MKHLLYIVLFVFPILCYSQTDTVIVSDRVGNVIDQYEREYFRLFPDADDFKSACFIPDSNTPNNVRIHIENSNHEVPKVLTLERQHVIRLAAYIDGYENMLLTESYSLFKRDYLVLYNEDVIGFIEVDDLIDITLRFSDNQHLTQTTMSLLYADSNVVIMSKNIDSFVLDSITIVNVKDIRFIEYTDGSAFWSGFGWGFGGSFLLATFGLGIYNYSGDGKGTLSSSFFVGAAVAYIFIGGVTGIINHAISYTNEEEIDDRQQYLDILPKLRERQFFKHGLPPELRTKIKAQ